ncbi:MAG TPA: ATP-dependent DNA helicase, partial [Rhodanobacteraceae bacterium]|nr:ATP-dependent DNA helicase [Rhodanobacteraceae bacterium]
IFQLGNTSYRILRVERGRVRVEDAQGMPPTIPFWLGEAPGRSDELSFAVSRLREEISARLTPEALSPDRVGGEGWVRGQRVSSSAEPKDTERLPLTPSLSPIASNGGEGVQARSPAQSWLIDEVGLHEPAALQLVDYLGGAKAALGLLPTQRELAMERFFDESGGTQLVIHSPFGSRLNRAWGLALRKRFCRKFNFELQAAATEDAIVLSLSTSHSFPLDEVTRYLHSNSVCDVLTQALLDAPMFGLRWRWNATTALALPRFVGGAKVPPQLQRMKSEDLLATVFPDQVACAENLVGEREIPEHPLVAQTLHDCLHEAMDIAGLERLLQSFESGEIHIVCRDLTAPSPLAAEILNARPYAYLDDAPLEERRTQAVMSRRWGDIDSTDDFGRLDSDAITAVREEAWPEARNADELHEALMGLGFLTTSELAGNAGWLSLVEQLVSARRATRLYPLSPIAGDGGEGWGEGAARQRSSTASANLGASPSPQPSPPTLSGEREPIVVAAERLPEFTAAFPEALLDPQITVPAEFAATEWTREQALVEIVRGRLSGLGPVRATDIAATLHLPQVDIDGALAALETEGFAMRGQFTPGGADTEWCERHLLARIHRYTVKRLRREIEPVEPRDFMRFLFEWQHVAPGSQVSGPDALAAVLAQLEGHEVAAAAWESDVLPARVAGYEISWLDDLCLSGRIVWTRLRAPSARETGGDATTRDRAASGPVRATPIVLLQRRNMPMWTALTVTPSPSAPNLSSRAQAVADQLKDHGASFFDELVASTRLLHTELEDALAELVANGAVTADSYAGLRALLLPSSKRPSPTRRRGRRTALFGIADAGRWSLLRRASPQPSALSPASPGKHPRAPAVDADAIEQIARILLKRYGVVCWHLMAREPQWLPPWRDLLRVFHRLEARGEIRGGRFIAGLSGEQFALPEAIGLMRSMRQKPHDGSFVNISGADPLNLVGHVVAGTRVPNQSGTRVLYRDGAPIATLVGGQFSALEPMDDAAEWAARSKLLRAHSEYPQAEVEESP